MLEQEPYECQLNKSQGLLEDEGPISIDQSITFINSHSLHPLGSLKIGST